MSNPTATQWAELDTQDIASIASEDLHTHRPNRWQGPESTWRVLTEEERSLYQSLKTRENQDLGTHLYNAFSLKQRSKDPELAEDLKVETEDGGEAVWAPPKMWTAWPLAEGRLPVEEFVARREDEDEHFTFRRKGVQLPGDDLREEVSATILRAAKKRFLKRKKAWSAMQTSVEEQEEEAEEDESGIDTEAETTEGDMDVDGSSDGSESASAPSSKRTKTYEPVVSADDDYSHKLMEPSVQHIISQLDSTLKILHHMRVSGDKDDDDDNEESEPDDSKSGDKDVTLDTPPLEPKLKTTKRGRPRKVHIPREGETHEEMLIRIARESHRRVPMKKKEAAARKAAREAKKKADAAFEAWAEKDDDTENVRGEDDDLEVVGGTPKGEPEEESEAQSEKFEAWLQGDEEEKELDGSKRLPRRRKGLQGWSEIVGAAALAGFPPEVIARTAQRCANLFGEGTTTHNLQETFHENKGVQTKEYRPEAIYLSDSDDELPDSEDDIPLEERRKLSRRNSRMQSRASSSPSPARSRSRSLSRTPRSRSNSVSAMHYCPVPECERAVRGFPRRGNLRRHMDLVHKGVAFDESASSAQSGSEVDSDDEMFGAVHVDGFLRPVVPSKGWRGEDVETRKRKKGGQKRSRWEETDDTAGDTSG